MSWETRLYCSIPFNRETFNSKYEVEERLEEVNKEINTCKDAIQRLVYMTEPSKFYNKDDYDSPLSFVKEEYESHMDLLEELYYEQIKLEFLNDNWKRCHTPEGLAIDPPEGIGYDTAFLDGDFVKTVNHPTNESLF